MAGVYCTDTPRTNRPLTAMSVYLRTTPAHRLTVNTSWVSVSYSATSTQLVSSYGTGLVFADLIFPESICVEFSSIALTKCLAHTKRHKMT